VTLGASEVSNEVEGKPAATLKLQDGETRFTPGNFAHIARNLPSTPFRNVTIEFLRDKITTQAKWDQERGLNVLSGGTQEIYTYDKYVGGASYDHTHWNDYYNITYTGGP